MVVIDDGDDRLVPTIIDIRAGKHGAADLELLPGGAINPAIRPCSLDDFFRLVDERSLGRGIEQLSELVVELALGFHRPANALTYAGRLGRNGP